MTTRTYATQANAPAGDARVRVADSGSCPAVSAVWSPIFARYGHGDQARSAPTDPGVPYVAPALQQGTHQAVGATRRPFCLCGKFETGKPWNRDPQARPARRRRDQGSKGDVRHPASRRDRDHPRTGLAGPRAVQRRQRVDDGAVLLRAARRHRRGQGVLPASARCEDECLDGAHRCGASRGACGVASCSCTERSSPRSASVVVRARSVPRPKRPCAQSA